VPSPTAASPPGYAQTAGPSKEPSEVRLAALQSPVEEQLPAPKKVVDGFSGMSELSVDALIQQVLARNPTLAQMVAAWQAASARYPQVTSLDDPMLAVTLGPQTYFSNTVNPAYRVNIQQKFPFPGKLGLRGQVAQAEASAAGLDVDDMRLQLVQSAQDAFYEYYLADRSLEVNAENLRLLKRFRENAKTRYENNLVPQQDFLQADVEIGRENERRLALEEMRHIVIARINTLMHLPPDSPLPPPPNRLSVSESLAEAKELRATALSRRPDLQALAKRIDADQAALALANKEFYPDFTPFAMYDRFMGNNSQSQPLAMMIGVSVNLPVRRDRRFAAVEEAQARLNQRRAELERQIDQVNFQVQEAYEKVYKSEQAVRIYEKTILPAAKLNVEAAQSAYETGKIPFLSLIEAQRNIVTLRDRYYEAVADYFRRWATLERVIGGPAVPPAPFLGAPGNAPGVPFVPRPLPAQRPPG
jgi:outer membrane protein TolC